MIPESGICTQFAASNSSIAPTCLSHDGSDRPSTMASRLLSLPRELRNEIYGYLLGGNHRFSIAHCYPLGHPMHPMTRKRVDLGTQKSIEITTLRALPGLHREPYLIAYSTVDTPLLCPALLRTCLQVSTTLITVRRSLPRNEITPT